MIIEKNITGFNPYVGMNSGKKYSALKVNAEYWFG